MRIRKPITRKYGFMVVCKKCKYHGSSAEFLARNDLHPLCPACRAEDALARLEKNVKSQVEKLKRKREEAERLRANQNLKERKRRESAMEPDSARLAAGDY